MHEALAQQAQGQILCAAQSNQPKTVEETFDRQIDRLQEQISRLEALKETLPQSFLDMCPQKLAELGLYL